MAWGGVQWLRTVFSCSYQERWEWQIVTLLNGIRPVRVRVHCIVILQLCIVILQHSNVNFCLHLVLNIVGHTPVTYSSGTWTKKYFIVKNSCKMKCIGTNIYLYVQNIVLQISRFELNVTNRHLSTSVMKLVRWTSSHVESQLISKCKLVAEGLYQVLSECLSPHLLLRKASK